MLGVYEAWAKGETVTNPILKKPLTIRPGSDLKDQCAFCTDIGVAIETEVWKLCGGKDVNSSYLEKVRLFVSNFKKPYHGKLWRQILGGKIEWSKVAQMTAEDLMTDKLKREM